jgi:hypothetical protein
VLKTRLNLCKIDYIKGVPESTKVGKQYPEANLLTISCECKITILCFRSMQERLLWQ